MLLKRYSELYECWTDLKFRYESDNDPRCFSLIEKFFNLHKTDGMSMDAYLVDIRNLADMLEEVECKLPEPVIVYYIINRLPKEFSIFKYMYEGGDQLPSFKVLEAKFLSEEQALALEPEDRSGEALALEGRRNFNNRRPIGRFGSTSQSRERTVGNFGNSSSSYYGTTGMQGGTNNYGSSSPVSYNSRSTTFTP
jgi:hypothetical protein